MIKTCFIKIICIPTILSISLLAGCSWFPSPHKIDVQQGNVISQESLNLLKPGMPKHKVRFIMGTPLINDSFHKDRWDYVYSFETGGTLQKTEQMTLYFQNDKLQKITGDMHPQPESDDTLLQHQKEIVVLVHPKIKEKGWFMKFLDKIGLGEDEYDVTSKSEQSGNTPHSH